MEGFTYHNIFETKGLEYLIIIAFLALLIPFSVILNRRVKMRRQLQHSLGVLTSGILRIPKGVFLSRNHTWAHLAKSGIASIGLDDLLLHITGEGKLVYLKNSDEQIEKGEVIAALTIDGKQLRITSPITGKVVASNALLLDEPWKINEEPYGIGWLYKIEPTNWKSDTESDHLAEAATSWSKSELQRFKDFLATRLPKYSNDAALVALQDGGELRDHLLPELPGGMWQEFETEFLQG
jgi:glycine cleavage system H protein